MSLLSFHFVVVFFWFFSLTSWGSCICNPSDQPVMGYRLCSNTGILYDLYPLQIDLCLVREHVKFRQLQVSFDICFPLCPRGCPLWKHAACQSARHEYRVCLTLPMLLHSSSFLIKYMAGLLIAPDEHVIRGWQNWRLSPFIFIERATLLTCSQLVFLPWLQVTTALPMQWSCYFTWSAPH